MRIRKLGKNGPELTVVGFGAWAIGGPWQFGWGKVDDGDSIKAIQSSISNGINWIDTAAVYGFGHSEEIVGKALKGIRQKVFVATKCGLLNDGSGNAVNNLEPKNIRVEIENSLRRLQTDYIDLYQFHWPDPSTPVEESWATMIDLKREGKVRYIGVSNFDVPLLERCMKIGQVQSLQPPFSMIKRNVSEEILPFCLNNEIGVVPYSPMQAGLLTGKFDMSRVAEDDWRRRNEFFKEPLLSKTLGLVEELRPIAKKNNKTVGNLAVAWVLKNPAITSAIVGARTTAQVQENVAAADYELTDEEITLIDGYLKKFGL